MNKYKFTVALSVLGLLTIMVPGRLFLTKLKQESSITALASPKIRPNIIIFSPDGIEADHMGIYGYHRNTTPNLKKYASQMLIIENAITNSGKSTGSATALLTGRLPTTTHVLFPPQVLTGENSEKHLPGLLWQLGYKNFQETARFYLDGPDLGMKDAFDVANGRTVGNRFSKNLPPAISIEFFSDFYFLAQIKDRFTERFAHLLRIRKMSNPFDEVNHDRADQDFRVYATPDAVRMQRAYAFIDEAPEPFFMHLHLMNSHCCKFRPEKKFFYKSDLSAETPVNNTDLYDDAILETDRYFGQLMDYLAKKGKLQNTVVIYLSDHGRIWTSALRIPLMFYFGGSAVYGTVKETAQLIDVAPTLLDYMGLSLPNWLEGQSLLSKEKRQAVRPLVSVAAVETQWFQGKGNEDLAKLVNMGPPYYGAKRMSVTYCHKQYRLELKTGKVDMFNLRNHTLPCQASDLPSPEEAITYLKNHLAERKFGVKK